MEFSLIILFLILIILIGISAFFSGSEIGMMSLNRYRLRHLAKGKNKQAMRVSSLLLRPDKLLGVILIGSTLANIVASTVATLIGQRLYGNAGVAIATILLTLVILVISEMIPKTLAALYPQQVAFAASVPLNILHIVMAPLVQTVSWATNGILRLFGVSLDQAQREALTADELRSVVNEAGGLLPLEHKSMLIGLLDLEKATVEDIMVPKADIVGIDLNKSWHEILDQLETAQHTRLPLYQETIDQLIGIVHVRSILNLSLEERLSKETLIKIADAPYFIPEETPLSTQILNFQKVKKRSSFVVDEYGDLQGLVTLEDILEEVVGEFTTDIATLGKDIIQQDKETVLVDASITLRHLKRLLGWQLPALGPRTLSGLIIEYLGYIPPADCCLKIENYQIEILKVSDNMVKTVRMKKVNAKRQ
ncbi:Mg2 and Co2 transporter [Legionella beliardensis]|uniref:Mg2 and Co2 transporter n=1 Tax=Legionella beliardensis TaxID=91822 RepID=A0A378HZ95_9GAMM|nr:HlyC/CorC family transporter [Legionella beliardensis]STX27831.1 Mg2 and Co2 transporter [Legionella beliardensis]